MTWQRKWICHLKRLLWSHSKDTRENLQMLFRTYIMEKIFKFAKSSRILLLSTKEKMNLKDSSYLPWQRCFFCLKPQRTYGLVTERSSNVRTCFTNCTQFMLQLAVTTHPVYTLSYQTKLKKRTMIRGTSRAPLFEPSIWNQNSAASEGLAKTTNAVEGWHYGIQSLFSGSHPDVWTFLRKFRQDALLHKLNALQAVTGHQKKPRRKYQQLNARVQTLINSYDENKENIIPFLRSIVRFQWLIHTICYSSYYNLVLCVLELFQKNEIFQKVVRIESPNFGAWIRAFSRNFSTLPRCNPVFPNSRKLEFV